MSGSGSTASSGGPGSSGSVDAGSAPHDASLACFEDGGKIVRQAKVCYAVDSECTVLIVHTCCGADEAIGLSKIAPQYAACYPQAGPGSCGGLGCAKFLGTSTEDGQASSDPVVAHCVVAAGGGQCMTSHVPPDAGGDATR
jgi:hypothetical protein